MLALLFLSAHGVGCAGRQAGYEKSLRECGTSGDAGRRVQRKAGVDANGGLSAPVDRAGNEVTEVRSDCVYSVAVQAGSRSWQVTDLSWVGEYAASPQGDRVAFTAQSRDGWHVVVDGALGPAYDGTLGRATFSGDGTHVMFVGFVTGSGGRVVVDGKEVASAPFGIDHGARGFTSGGRYLVAIRTKDDGLQVSASGVLGPRLDSNGSGPGVVASMTDLQLTTSLSGDRFAYVGTSAGRPVLVVDGREVPVPSGVLPRRPLFSATGARFLFQAVPVGGDTVNPPALVLDGTVHRIPGLISAAFVGGEIPMATSSLPLGMTTTMSQTHLFGVDRIDGQKPPDEPADRIVLNDRALDPAEIELQADGVLTHRGQPVARVRGRRTPTIAE